MEQACLLTIFTILCCVFGHSASEADNSKAERLFLTPYIQNGTAEEARNRSELDSTKFLDITSYSGFITVNKEYNSNLFFWFFPASTNLTTTPWIIWLQGGPGYSSMKGLFDIIGPIKVEEGKVVPRNITWASDYSLLFLDNPVGAGFSFTDDDRGYPTNEDDVGAQMLEFLQQFLKMFPELRSAPLFIAGQSYAGKYVPALGIQIHRHNENKTNEKINLRGITIGNGLVDLRDMMHYSRICAALGLLDEPQLEHLEVLEEQVVSLIDEKKLVDAANKFNESIEFIKKHSGVSIYKFTEESSSAAPEFEDYIKRDDVRELIHVGNATFNLDNQLVYKKMLNDFANTSKKFVEQLLEHYGVMCYSGQLDVILPYSASKHMHRSLQWSRREGFLQAQRKRLRRHLNGSVVGYKKAGGNLVEILVRGAGHSVPSDQPDVAKFIMDAFIQEYK
ncbi:venom serine carboxypeptidase-like isoform X2 [Trichoplusia ni]|uniref:Venom serine carboxypeptidase-like isoform X2 n=1 Tax=Trichoplusia ni TaxID=7111 RepID=A0A7E5VEW3_TRINI|nr:venom serine carboxypeptidase-like isoform X2 [Trichoplusia ni]